ncbi:MAG: hypothetical protein U5J78_07085 [Parasphingorhabdus sp.]|nr:hypothetical protein [Parasphingorhabdus sp.]
MAALRQGVKLRPRRVAPVRALATKSFIGQRHLDELPASLVLVDCALGLEEEIYLLGALTGHLRLARVQSPVSMAKDGRSANMLSTIVGDFSGMPEVMKRLALVQFFSWSALFIMWINTSPIVAQYF